MNRNDGFQHGSEQKQSRYHQNHTDVPRSRHSGWPRRRFDGESPIRLSEAFDQFIGWLKKPPVDLLVVVFNNWEDVVGPDVAAHCRPVAIDANQLVVVADDPMWADELRWNSEKVLDRLVEVSGASRLEKLTVRVGCYGQRDDD